MARDKRGQTPEPTVDDGLDDMTDPGTGESFVAGPTSRNEVGNTKRAAAKATGNMSASKKIDPDLTMEGVEGDRPKSGSKAAIHGFKDVGAQDGEAEFRSTRSNAEIADEAVTTARKSPARRPARTTTTGGITALDSGNGRRRVPRPAMRSRCRRASSCAASPPPANRRHVDLVDRRDQAAEALWPARVALKRNARSARADRKSATRPFPMQMESALAFVSNEFFDVLHPEPRVPDARSLDTRLPARAVTAPCTPHGSAKLKPSDSANVRVITASSTAL